MIEMMNQLRTCLDELNAHFPMNEEHILVVGCSTSEVAGEHIGTAGTLEAAGSIFTVFKEFQTKTKVQLAFQCCEHLNRALVVSKQTAKENHLTYVSVIPAQTAGGALATTAYKYLVNPVIVESIQADVGIDIGDTFIGMHLKPVAVPVRSSVNEVGKAHVTMAMTRPKLIGGNRAIYK
ncbi:MAG: hypothetical protein K0R18_1761 [Bacillales bacterium]|jgi:uncharacterized protein (TIGR01440 family)|nr:hypothetical protein [Bacillales bacterium]